MKGNSQAEIRNLGSFNLNLSNFSASPRLCVRNLPRARREFQIRMDDIVRFRTRNRLPNVPFDTDAESGAAGGPKR
jgi:hypothetical protein